MGRFINTALVKIIAECRGNLPGKRLLTRLWIVAVQKTLGNSQVSYLSKQIDQSNPQVFQYWPDLRSATARFILFNQSVVGRFFVPPQISFFAGQLNDLLEVRFECRKLAFVASVNPRYSSHGSGFFEFFDE